VNQRRSPGIVDLGRGEILLGGHRISKDLIGLARRELQRGFEVGGLGLAGAGAGAGTGGAGAARRMWMVP
jgi:hypothetical protein